MMINEQTDSCTENLELLPLSPPTSTATSSSPSGLTESSSSKPSPSTLIDSPAARYELTAHTTSPEESQPSAATTSSSPYELFESDFVAQVNTFGVRYNSVEKISECRLYRRLDSLARLLELDSNCAAASVFNGSIFIAINQQKDDLSDQNRERRHATIIEVMEYFKKVADSAKKLNNDETLDLNNPELNRTNVLRNLLSIGRFRKRISESGIKSVFLNDADYEEVFKLMLSNRIFDLTECSKFYDTYFASIGLPTV